jgi:hypothetical protein
MAAAASKVYTGSGIVPVGPPERVKTDSYVLAPGTYAAGTALGQNATLTNAADVQTITITGTPTGGTFILSFAGQNTTALAYNAAAADVQAALVALSTIGAGNMACSSGPFPGTAVVCTFQGALVNSLMPSITVYSASLTGGTAPAVSVAHTTPGRSAAGQWNTYASGNTDGTQVAKAILEFNTFVDTFGNHKSGGGDWGQGTTKSAPVFTAGDFKTADIPNIDSTAVASLGRIVKGAVGNLTNAGTVLRVM